MNEKLRTPRNSSTATVVLLACMLFYLPSALAIVTHDGEPMVWAVFNVAMATCYTVVFCVNYFMLVPATLRRPGAPSFYAYLGLNLCMIIAICSLIPVWFELHGGLPHPRHSAGDVSTFGTLVIAYLRFLIRDGVMMVLAAALAYAMRLSRDHEQMRRRELELNAERRKIELRSLKAQLNPHFLFNSLNNIYALIGMAPERAQQALHDLSSMLRFMIYDAGEAVVPLEKELKFITDYVEMMRLRLSSSVRLTFNVGDIAGGNLYIAPLLFLTLVENAFKHSGSNGNDHFIFIDIHERDLQLVCRVENSYAEDREHMHPTKAESGIGLENVTRQLGLLYPGEYTYSSDRENGIYRCVITISLNALHHRTPTHAAAQSS
ncbi:MAG: histidine kinase [Bacteroidales bacterium]|nr:histidine kinase [Bacteroidales bacterium]